MVSGSALEAAPEDVCNILTMAVITFNVNELHMNYIVHSHKNAFAFHLFDPLYAFSSNDAE